METKVQQPEVSATSLKSMQALEGAEPQMPIFAPTTKSDEQLQEIGRKISNFLEQLPIHLGSFFQEYKLPIISFALLVVVVAALKIVVAVLDALNDVPLLYPTFELIGISYATWFTFRYLLKASTRQELAAELHSIKKQIVGRNTSEPLS